MEPKFDVAEIRKDTNYIIDINDEPLDRISKSEHQVLLKLKEHPIAKDQSDHFLMIFLFARKFDIKRTVELLTVHLKWREENGYMTFPKREEVNQTLLKSCYSFSIPRKTDKEGKIITYIMLKNMDWRGLTSKDIIHHMMYVFGEALKEPLVYHRNGVTYLEDVKGFSFGNYDTKIARDMNNSVQNNFPFRVGAIYVCNAGVLIRGLIAFARFLGIKKKIIKRVHAVVNMEDLKKYVDPDNMIKHFGGNIPNPWEDSSIHYI